MDQKLNVLIQNKQLQSTNNDKKFLYDYQIQTNLSDLRNTTIDKNFDKACVVIPMQQA